MPIYNLIENSSNYSDTTDSLWFYTKDEAITFNANIANNNVFKSFEYKAKLLGNTVADENNSIWKNATTTVSRKYLSNFWILIETLLINCKVELKLIWIKHCVLAAAVVENDVVDSTNITLTIKETKLYVPVVTLSAKDNKKPSNIFSKGFERSVYWN